jgi:plasmid stabilization system protein ParE
MKHRVIITPTAAADIAEEVAHISDDSLGAAAQWYDGCLGALESLGPMPQRCRLAPEADTFQREIRQLVYHSHRILFEVVGDTVNVLHVRHAARLPLTPGEAVPPEREPADD